MPRSCWKSRSNAIPHIDRATVYRTIALLKDRGLIDELDLMHLEGEKHYYEAKTNRDHCHMACFGCGAIIEYASPAFEKLKKEMARQRRFSDPRCAAGGRRLLQGLPEGRALRGARIFCDVDATVSQLQAKIKTRNDSCNQ